MAADRINSIQDINTHCLAEFRKHWECLDDRNHQLWQCRPAEWKLNKCVFDNLVCHLGHPAHDYPDMYILTAARNSRRRFPTSPPTSPPFTFDQSRSLPTCASALATASPLSQGRRRRSNKELEALKDRDSIMYICRMNHRVDNQLLNLITMACQPSTWCFLNEQLLGCCAERSRQVLRSRLTQRTEPQISYTTSSEDEHDSDCSRLNTFPATHAVGVRFCRMS